MLRTKLTFAFAACLAVVFLMAALLFWGPAQMSHQLRRSLLTHQQAEGYLRLSNEAYRHFWHLADELIVENAASNAQRLAGQERLRARIEELERLTIEELVFVGPSEPAEQQELWRITQLAEAIAASIVAFNAVLEGDDAPDQLAIRLDLLHQKIDRNFSGLINAAIDDEHAESDAADEEVRALSSQLAYLAAGLALAAAVSMSTLWFWLLHSIKRPIDLLMEGTEHVARGDLSRRIPLKGSDELAHLASNFNRMTGDLERQRNALMRSQAELEQNVRERTTELQQANLTLQRLDEVRRGMFADISHELRTPLTIIAGEAEVTLRNSKSTSEDYRSTLRRILDLAGQVAKLVEDLVILARSETADLRIQRRPIVIEEMLRESFEDLKTLAGVHGLVARLDIQQAGEHLVDADRARLAQLLLILVDNACRYSDPGGTISITLCFNAPAAELTVKDSGIGIPPEEIAAVFDRYFRGQAARARAPRGSGLGLHVAKAIAEAHDGHLTIQSASGIGTSVTLSIPLLQPDGDAHADTACRG